MEGVVLLLVALAPWFYGAVDPVFEYGLFIGVGIVALLWGVCSVIDGRFLWFSCPVTLALGGIFLVGAIQLVPIPSWALAVVSPAAAGLERELLPTEPELIVEGEVPASHSGWPAISIYPTATRQLLMRLLAVFILFAAVRTHIASTASLKRLAWLAMVNGVLLSLFGLWQFVQTRSAGGLSLRSVFGYDTRTEVFGPFINRNHFAYYANICIGLTVALLLIGTRSESDKRARRTYKAQALEEQTAEDVPTLSILGILHSPLQLWLSVAITVIIAGLICSMSRGGVAAIVAGIVIAFCLRGFAGKHVKRLELAVVPVLLLVGFVAWLGVKPLESRLNPFNSDAASDGRLQIWKNVLPLAWRFPVFGTGYGTLQYAEPLYRETDYDGYTPTAAPTKVTVFVDHAHNDYLEAWIEGGFPRFVMTVATVALLLRYGRRAMKRHEIRTPGRMAFGALIGVAAVAVHNFVDFGLFTPAVAVLATVTAAQLCGMARSDPSQPPTAKSKHSIALSLGGWGGAAAMCVFILLALLLAGFGSRQARVHALRVQAFQALKKSQNPDLGEIKLRSAVQLAPDDAELRTELGQVYLDARQTARGKPEQRDRAPLLDEAAKLGLEQMIAARDLCPFLARPQARLAAWAIDSNAGNPPMAKSDPAEKYWARAVLLAPYDADLLYYAGQFQLQRGKQEAAWDLWQRSLARRPAHLVAIVKAAFPKLGADGLMTHILPNDPAQLIDTAKLLNEQSSSEIGQRKLLLKAKGLLSDPSDVDSAHRLGESCALLGEVEAARSYYRQVLDLMPHKYEWRYEWAKFLDSLGTEPSRHEALIEIDKVLEQAPNYALAVQLRQKIRRDLKIRD
jgi:O-antigen ligase/tetratricopeptide (TPR) repeat protein